MVPPPESPPPAAAGPSRPAGAGRAVRLLTAVELGIAAAAAALVFVLVLVQAFQRYLPVDGWTWTGELARYGLVWLTFVAAGILVTRDGHIALQVVDSIRSEPVVRTVHVVADLVVALTGAGFAWACWTLMQDSNNLSTPSLGMPMVLVYSFPLLGFVSTAVRSLVAAYLVLRYGVPASRERDSLAIDVNGPEQGATA